MLKRMKSIDVIVKFTAGVKPDERVLIVADDHGSSIKMGRELAETCTDVGAEVVMTIMAPRQYNGHEPPASVAAAMLECDVVFIVASGGPPIVHTTAAKAAREKGIRNVLTGARDEKELLEEEMSIDALNRTKDRTERIAEILSSSESVRISSSTGTDIRMSIKGRTGLSLHPMNGAAVIVASAKNGEAATAPVEGSTEGVLVSEGNLNVGWDSPREPVRLSIKRGRVTKISGPEDYVEKLKEWLATDENASNCAAELGIGTCEKAPRYSRAGLGTCHIGVGRNNDIGGETFSKIHGDLVILYPTLWLDDLCLIKDGELNLP